MATILQRASGTSARALLLLRSLPNKVRILAKDRADSKSQSEAAVSRGVPSIKDRRAQMLAFYSRYEALIETLCDAAQYGPEAHLEVRYQDLRDWLQAYYPTLRRFVVAYLEYDPSDAALGLETQGRGTDAFEALFVAPTIAEFLRCDDGLMISRILRTRTAVNLYADHLRQLDT